MSTAEQYIREAEIVGYVHKVIACKCEGIASGWVTAEEWLEDNKPAMNRAVMNGRVFSVQTSEPDDADFFQKQYGNNLRLIIVRDDLQNVPPYPVYESPHERDFLRSLFALDRPTLDRLKGCGLIGEAVSRNDTL